MKIFTPKQFEAYQNVQNAIQQQEESPKRYSKLKILRQLKELNVWDTVKAAIESAGFMDEWLVAQELASDDRQFMEMLNAISLEGVSVEEILSKAEITDYTMER